MIVQYRYQAQRCNRYHAIVIFYTETNFPNPLKKVGWGIFSSVTVFVPILIYSGFPDFFSKGARNL